MSPRSSMLVGLSLLVCLASSARVHADDTTPVAPVTAQGASAEPAPASAPSPAANRFMVHLNFGLVAYNWAGASGATPSSSVTLADRQTIVQLAGIGYFLRPNLRVMLSVQLAETVGGGKPGSSAFTLGGVIPWIAWHPIAPVFLGVGALLAPRSYAQWTFDAGVFTCVGATLPLGAGFALGAAVQVPIMFVVRPTVSLVPAVFLAYRF